MRRATIYSLLIITIGYVSACGPTGATTEQPSSSSPAFYPSWYSASSQFMADSVSITGLGMAVGVDSASAAASAERLSRANLESGVAKMVEDARKEVVDTEGSGSVASKPDFIFTLRNAHQLSEERAEITNVTAVQKDSTYYGFASAKLSKEALRSLLTDQMGKAGYQSTVEQLELK